MDLYNLPELQGSVAQCSVRGSVLTKLYLEDARTGLERASRTFRAAGWALELVTAGAGVALGGLADACDGELDAEREWTMQATFSEFATAIGSGVRIPKPFAVLPGGTGLKMEYLGRGSLRFCDCKDDELRARAVVSVSRLFFSAIKERGLVHGDISQANVLVDKQGLPCLVDFGSCLYAPENATTVLNAKAEMENEYSNAETSIVMSLWEDRTWVDGWDKPLDAVTLKSLSFNGREDIPGLALILRSIMGLTFMARQVPASHLRQAEAEWLEARTHTEKPK
jgi:hypothetical protein